MCSIDPLVRLDETKYAEVDKEAVFVHELCCNVVKRRQKRVLFRDLYIYTRARLCVFFFEEYIKIIEVGVCVSVLN